MSRVERNRGLGGAFEEAVRRKPVARRTRALCKIEWSEAEVLKLTGVGGGGGLARVWKRESMVEDSGTEGAK